MISFLMLLIAYVKPFCLRCAWWMKASSLAVCKLLWHYSHMLHAYICLFENGKLLYITLHTLLCIHLPLPHASLFSSVALHLLANLYSHALFFIHIHSSPFMLCQWGNICVWGWWWCLMTFQGTFCVHCTCTFLFLYLSFFCDLFKMTLVLSGFPRS